MTLRQESLCLAALLGLWFALNLATLGRSPTVWQDEVMFSDAAVHWVQGRGLTSTAWPQPPDTPAVLNGPLYTLLLCAWLKAWALAGVAVSVTLVRSLNGVLAGLAALWLWDLVRRSAVPLSPGLRLCGVAAFLCANGVSASYRSGRYDMVGLLLVLAGVASMVRSRPRGARPGDAMAAALVTALLAALVPFAGLHLVPYCLLLAGGALLGGGRVWIGRVGTALLGLALGGAALIGMHLWLGTFPYFLAFTRQQSGAPIAAKFAAIPASIVCDASVVPLLGFLAVCLVARTGQGEAPLACLGRRMPLALLGLVAGIGIPLGMTLAGKYARFYGWMAFVPVLLIVLCAMERAARRTEDGGRRTEADHGPCAAPAMRSLGARWRVWLGRAALGAAMAVGLPWRTLVCVLEWHERDYGKVCEFVQAQVRADDRVLVGYSAYYPVTQIVGMWYLPGSLTLAHRPDPRAITCIVDRPELAQRAIEQLRGDWQMTAEYRAEPAPAGMRFGRAQSYHLAVYRRAPPPRPTADAADRRRSSAPACYGALFLVGV